LSAGFSIGVKFKKTGVSKMNGKILVTYASRTGVTASIADAIGKTLSETGEKVDVLAMHEVKDLSPYRAVVAGSAIRAAKWLPEAMQFLEAHQAELALKPFAAFTVCITLAMSTTEQYRSAVAGWVAPVRALGKPVSEGYFPGMLDFSKLPLNWDTIKLRLTVAIGVFPKNDRRDWGAVRAWAESLSLLLR
jgi:menaquinone-dependent protoporphyrinogen oxidase